MATEQGNGTIDRGDASPRPGRRGSGVLEKFFKSFLAAATQKRSVERMLIRRLLALLTPTKPHARQLELPLHDGSRAGRRRFGKHVRLSRFAIRISRPGPR